MAGLLRSLRFRLIILFVMLFGAIQVTISVVALLAHERYLRRYFDQQLILRMEGMAEQLINSRQRFFAPTLSRIINDETKSIYFRDFYVQLRDAHGEPIARSDNLGDFRLPHVDGEHPGGAHLQTLSGPELDALIGPGESLRMATTFVQEPNIEPFYLEVATSAQHVEESIESMRSLFVVGIPVGLLAAAVASWVVAGHAVTRIRAVGELAAQVTPEGLSHRLAPPSLDDEIGQMVERVNAMLDRLEAGFRAQERFIHDASHELKTPLSALLSEAQVLRMGQASAEDHRRFIDSVEEEVRHLGRLVESLLMLTRSDSRNLLAHRQAVEVNDMVVAAVHECQPVAEQYSVQLVVRLGDPEQAGVAPRTDGDGELLTAMVSNLIRNAIRFSPANASVDVDVACADDSATITVRDHGPGIPDDALGSIFDRFAQAGNDSPRRGTGLGLAIAKSVAELHGGSIAVANADGGGAVFTVRLPLLGPSSTH